MLDGKVLQLQPSNTIQMQFPSHPSAFCCAPPTFNIQVTLRHDLITGVETLRSIKADDVKTVIFHILQLGLTTHESIESSRAGCEPLRTSQRENYNYIARTKLGRTFLLPGFRLYSLLKAQCKVAYGVFGC